MEWQLLVTLFVAVLGGGGIVKLFEFFFQRKDKELEHDERIIRLVVDEVTKQRDEAYARLAALERKYDLLELEVQGLRLVNGRDPFPRWLVDMQGKYIYINQCFEERFLKPIGKTAKDMIGETHESGELWTPEFCSKMKLLDEKAKSRIDGRAKATLKVGGKLITVYKLPVRHIPSGSIMAYEGWITDIEVEEQLG